jgi:hypothetical protein
MMKPNKKPSIEIKGETSKKGADKAALVLAVGKSISLVILSTASLATAISLLLDK